MPLARSTHALKPPDRIAPACVSLAFSSQNGYRLARRLGSVGLRGSASISVTVEFLAVNLKLKVCGRDGLAMTPLCATFRKLSDPNGRDDDSDMPEMELIHKLLDEKKQVMTELELDWRDNDKKLSPKGVALHARFDALSEQVKQLLVPIVDSNTDAPA